MSTTGRDTSLRAPSRRTVASFATIVALVLLLALGLAACGDDGDTTTTGGDTATTGGGTATTGGSASSDTTPPAPPAGDKLFATWCAGCHGNDGKSGFSPPVVGVEADDVREAVTQGKGDMAGFGDQLSTEEIDAIVEYVGSLQ